MSQLRRSAAGPTAFHRTMLVSLATVTVLGCTRPNAAFVPGVADGGPWERAPSPDAFDAGTAPRTCPRENADLALCLRCEGVVADESRHAHPITHAAVGFVPGEDGAACELGATSVVRVAESPALDLPAFTLQAWIHPRALPAAGSRAGLIDRDVAYGLFLLGDGAVLCSIPGGNSVTAPGAVRVRAWTSVACTLGGGALAVWIDGRKQMEVSARDLSAGTGGGVTIGSNNPSGENFDGLLDNVRIWRGPQSPQAICDAARTCRP